MKVIITAGGTGGHIYPALAIVNKIKEKEPNSEFLYIGTKDRMEATIVPNKGIPYLGIEMKGLNRKNPFKNIKVIHNMFKNIRFLKKKIKEFDPDIVIGVAGYVTAPVIYAAKKLGYKTFIHEQNSEPGVSNKFLSRYANKIGVSLEDSIKFFPKDKTVYTGNPRSEEVACAKKVSKNMLGLGLSNDKKLVVMVMGSLGSNSMNAHFKDTLPLFNNKEYEVVFVTGKNYYDEYKDIKTTNNVKIVPYIDNMVDVLNNTDLIVSRAGATSIAEITALGIPSIIVPSPYLTNNHQIKNGQVLENRGCSIVIQEKEYDDKEFVATIDKILNNKELYNKLKTNSYNMGVRDSASRIYDVIRKMIDGE